MKRIIVALPLVTVPLLFTSLRGTHVMALVANARKFGANKIHGSFKTHNLTRADKTAWAVFALTIITVCLLLVLGIGRRDTLG